jgi:hypothetical protein
MATYRLKGPVYVAANGYPTPQTFRGGEVIDYDGVPSQNMLPLDDAAVAAVAARDEARGFKLAPNGVQAVDLRTGKVRVTRAGDEKGQPR